MERGLQKLGKGLPYAGRFGVYESSTEKGLQQLLNKNPLKALKY